MSDQQPRQRAKTAAQDGPDRARLQECAQQVAATLSLRVTAAFAACRDQLFDQASSSEQAGDHQESLQALRELNGRQSVVIDRLCAEIRVAMIGLAPDPQVRQLKVPEHDPQQPPNCWADAAAQIDEMVYQAAARFASPLEESARLLRALAALTPSQALDHPLLPRPLTEAFLRACQTMTLNGPVRQMLLTGFKRHVLDRLDLVLARIPGMPEPDAIRHVPDDKTPRVADDVTRLVSRLRNGGLKLPHVKQPEAREETTPRIEPDPTVRPPRHHRIVAPLILLLAATACVALAYQAGYRWAAWWQPSGTAVTTGQAETARVAAHIAAAPLPAEPDLPADNLKLNLAVVRPDDNGTSLAVDAGIPALAVLATPVVVDERLQIEIRQLLRRAESAMENKQLSNPIDGSAFASYRAVLALDPGNIEALRGITRIVAEYQELIRQALAEGQLDRARRYLSRAALVEPNAPEIAKLRADIERRRRTAAVD